MEKCGSTPMLANHKKRTFQLKRSFLGERQRLVRRLSNQISRFSLEYVHMRGEMNSNRYEILLRLKISLQC